MPLLFWTGSDVCLSHAEFFSSQGYELLLAAWLLNHGAGMLETFQTQQGYFSSRQYYNIAVLQALQFSIPSLSLCNGFMTLLGNFHLGAWDGAALVVTQNFAALQPEECRHTSSRNTKKIKILWGDLLLWGLANWRNHAESHYAGTPVIYTQWYMSYLRNQKMHPHIYIFALHFHFDGSGFGVIITWRILRAVSTSHCFTKIKTITMSHRTDAKFHIYRMLYPVLVFLFISWQPDKRNTYFRDCKTQVFQFCGPGVLHMVSLLLEAFADCSVYLITGLSSCDHITCTLHPSQ